MAEMLVGTVFSFYEKKYGESLQIWYSNVTEKRRGGYYEYFSCD